jgi:hypothetical protein
MKIHIVIHRTIGHLRAVIIWGIVAVVIERFYGEAEGAMIFALRRGKYPWVQSFIPIFGWFRDVFYFPSMWIRPQTMFNNEFWCLLSIGAFWGLVIHFTGVVLRGAWRRDGAGL